MHVSVVRGESLVGWQSRAQSQVALVVRNEFVDFEWFEEFGLPTETFLGSGDVLAVPLSLGVHAVTLQVTDTGGATDTDDASIMVVDSTPPGLTVSLFPADTETVVHAP